MTDLKISQAMLIECHMYLLFLSRYNFFYFLFALLFLYEHRELLTFDSSILQG